MTDKITIEVPADAEIIINGEVYQPTKKSWVWEPKNSNSGYVIWSDGGIEESPGQSKTNRNLYELGNLLETRYQAERELLRRKLTKRYTDRIAELNEGWKHDFTNYHEDAYIISIDNDKLCITVWSNSQFQPTSFHIKSQELGKNLLTEFTEDELKLIITGE